MHCTLSSYKAYLVCCNVGLLFVGLTVLILGMNMQSALSVLLLDKISFFLKAVKAIISTGFFITIAGLTGLWGTCYELAWLLMVHLGALGVIVIMEFSLGITLMVIRNTLEMTLETTNCNDTCISTLDSVILDQAVPSAGVLMTIIIVQASMIYSTVKVYGFIRAKQMPTQVPSGSAIQTVRINNVNGYRTRQLSSTMLPPPVPPQPILASPFQYQTRQPTILNPYPRSSLEPSTSPLAYSPTYATTFHPEEDPPTYAEAVPGSAQV